VTSVPSTASESSAPLARAPALTCAACHLPVHRRITKLLALRRILVQSRSGSPLIVTPSNVLTVIQHHEAAKLVVGVNMGGIVALNMLVEVRKEARRLQREGD